MKWRPHSLPGHTLGAAVFALFTGACGGRATMSNDDTGSETHWLQACANYAECPGDCICGVCTVACTDSVGCASGPPGSKCTAAGSSALDAMCGTGSAPAGACLLPCDGTCPGGSSCIADRCVPDFAEGTRDAGLADASSADAATLGGASSADAPTLGDASSADAPTLGEAAAEPLPAGPCGALLREIDIGPNAPRSLTFSPDGTLLAVASQQNGVLVFDVNGATLRYALSDRMGFASDAAFSPDGAVLAGGGASPNIALWSMSDGTLARSIPTACQDIFDVEFSHDGELLLTACNTESATIRRVSDGSVVSSTPAVADSVSFSPDDELFATADDDGVTLWRTATGASVLEIAATQCNRVHFSPDGRFVVAQTESTTYEIFDTEHGTSVQTFAAHHDAVWAGADRLVTNFISYSFQIWAGTPGLMALACEVQAMPVYYALAAFEPGNLVAVPSRADVGATYVGIYSTSP